jgi:hypothetical protein
MMDGPLDPDPNTMLPIPQWTTTAKIPMRLVTEKRNFMFIKSEMKPMRRTMSGARAPPRTANTFMLSRSPPLDEDPVTLLVAVLIVSNHPGNTRKRSPMTIVIKERTLNVKDAAARLTVGSLLLIITKPEENVCPCNNRLG